MPFIFHNSYRLVEIGFLVNVVSRNSIASC